MYLHNKNNSDEKHLNQKNKFINNYMLTNAQTIDIKSKQILNYMLDTIDQKGDNIQSLQRSLNLFDKQLQNLYCTQKTRQNSLQSTIYNKTRSKFNQNNQNKTISSQILNKKSDHNLKIPKPNTLTDKFLKNILGSEQQLIQDYDRTVNPQKYKQKQLQQKAINIKELFKQKQNFQVPNTNTNINIGFEEKTKAFIDQSYYTYLKTNMKYLQNLNSKNNQNKVDSNQKNKKIENYIKGSFIQQATGFKKNIILQSSDNFCSNIFHPFSSSYHPQSSKIVQKLKQTGGIENTIQKMQRSLKKNQIKHLAKNKYLLSINNQEEQFNSKRQDMDSYQKRNNFHVISLNNKSFKQSKTIEQPKSRSSWVQKSRSLRDKYKI